LRLPQSALADEQDDHLFSMPGGQRGARRQI
jgi:hypothetical protein